MSKMTIPFSVPNIDETDKKAVADAMSCRWLTGGPKAKEFEDQFVEYLKCKYAVSVNSCTAALHLSLKALGIKPGDEVIVPDITFAATANSVLFCGAKPVFADIDEKTLNISVDEIQNKLTKNTKAIIPVHYGGLPCDMDAIREIAEENKLFIVEDCAHSLGSTYKMQMTGTFGIGCFSFYPTKNITTIEGGMISTNDVEIARKCSLGRTHGMTKDAFDREKFSWYYDVVDLGYNYRLNEVQAALGISQLKRLDSMNEQRRKIAQYYTSKLSRIPGIITPVESAGCYHTFHLYVIKVIKDDFGLSRDQLFIKLQERGIGLSLHYTPLHLLTYYKSVLGYKKGDFPVAEKVYDQILSLPMYPQLTETEIDYVVEQVSDLYKNR